MTLRTLSARSAAALDEHLMSSGAFSLDQLMELAGLSVSQAVYHLQPPSLSKRISVLIACGPGNNGGDGLVAARHLHHLGYAPSIYYPKQGKAELYGRLATQLKELQVPRVDDFAAAVGEADVLVDAVFGFSFSGAVREPFPAVIEALKTARVPVLAVDAPSGWDIEAGPPEDGPAQGYMPTALISLTAPKPLARHFTGRHFVGGRFLDEETAKKFGIDVAPYEGVDQVVEVDVKG